jgi:hypothetical protein
MKALVGPTEPLEADAAHQRFELIKFVDREYWLSNAPRKAPESFVIRVTATRSEDSFGVLR